MKNLASEIVARMSELTDIKSHDIALSNTELNLPYIQHHIGELQEKNPSGSHSAIVIGAGPSLHIRKSISRILSSEYSGCIVCADGALPHCLRLGLIPDYVVSLDPHPWRIVRWFGDPELNENNMSRDDYFQRQDLDPRMGDQELERNQEVLGLVDTYGTRIKAILATCSSQSVTQRCISAKMQIYWWNPLYDDYTHENSLSRRVYSMNKIPCMATGGNTGTSAWAFACSILNIPNIALIGMDFGYAPGTPYEKTQYYEEIAELFGESYQEAYIDVYNPYTKEMWFTDPTYYWYREVFLELARSASNTTYNCTEGGTLFGKGIEMRNLDVFLASTNQSSGKINV